MKFTNCYSNVSSIWKKGTIHVHTANSICGHYPAEKVCDMYFDRIMQYDFIALTDHMHLTIPPEVPVGRQVYAGEEFKRHLKQILGVGLRHEIDDDPDNLLNHQQLIENIHAQGGIAVICHPHLYENSYWALEDVLALHEIDAIEIYNHNSKMNNAGRSIASDLWDSLLCKGKIIWGMANDDMHHCSRIGGGYIKVQADGKNILDQIRNGAFYSSTGIDARSYIVGNKIVEITFDNDVGNKIETRLIVDGEITLRAFCSSKAEIPLPRQVQKYFRIEAYREDGAFIWFQPHFIEKRKGE